MEKEVNEIVSSNLKDILKIVIIGFITLDFFSPITFKFIAGLFKEENRMMWTFSTFRVLYLSLPLIFLFGFSIYKINVKNLLNRYDVADFKRHFVILSVVLLLFIIFAFFSIGRLPLKIDKGIEVISLQFKLIVIIFLLVSIYLLFSLRRDRKLKYFIQAVYIFLFSITVVGTVFILFFRNLTQSKEHLTTSLKELYIDPFTKQKSFKDASLYVEALDSEKESISKATFEIAMKASLFDFKGSSQEDLTRINSSLINHLEKTAFTKDTSSNIDLISCQLKYDIEKLSSGSIKKSELQDIKTRADFVNSSLTLRLFHAESSLAEKGRQAKKAALLLLRFVQVVELIFLVSIIALLLLTIRFFNSFKSLSGKTMYLETTLIIYLLMAVQMVKPIDPRHIDINDPGWPFTQPTWYLPGYIQSIGTISNTNPISINTEKTTVRIQERISQEEFSNIKNEITNLRNSLDGKIKKIEDDLDTIKDELR